MANPANQQGRGYGLGAASLEAAAWALQKRWRHAGRRRPWRGEAGRGKVRGKARGKARLVGRHSVWT